jgi:NADPH2:quinone reductase
MRRSAYVYAPPIPFVPGYEVVGEVEALGPGVTSLRLGQRVAALLVHGGYAEKLVRPADIFVPVPDGVEDGAATALILNYATAYQAIHRIAHIQPGAHALVTGANGGVGTALLELLPLAGAQAIGAAASRHHEFIRSLGATPIEGRSAPADRGVRALFPQGVDAAFDALGGRYLEDCRRATRRGGAVVGYGFSGVTGNQGVAFLGMMTTLFVVCPLSGRRGAFYGITALYRKDRRPFLEDLAKLFDLLAAGKLNPRIAARLPLLAARQAAELLEAGGVEGKIVNLASVAG